MRLILVRHGETEENIRNIIQGHLPGKLSAKGKQQARLIAKSLKHTRIDCMYVSDLKRTKDTAKSISTFHPRTPVIYEPAIFERNFGIYTGKPGDTVRKVVNKLGVSYITYRPPHGESVIDVRKRMIQFLETLKKRHPRETVLLISHAAPMTQLILNIIKKPATRKNYENIRPNNTALTIIDFKPGKKPHVRIINSTRHLKT